MSTIHPHICGLSASLECKSEMCLTWLAENTGCRSFSLPSVHHCTTVGQEYRLHMSSQYGELGPTNGWYRLASLEHSAFKQRVCVCGLYMSLYADFSADYWLVGWLLGWLVTCLQCGEMGEWQEVPSSCALLGRFAIGAQVSLLWQHSAEREMSVSACTRSMPG